MSHIVTGETGAESRLCSAAEKCQCLISSRKLVDSALAEGSWKGEEGGVETGDRAKRSM